MVKLCLNMIVKNEEKIITRMLESVVEIIDFFIICDTGSTDKTKEIIQNFFKDYPNIKGCIVDDKFENFEYNRNKALNYCKDLGDYILLMDADHILKIKNFDKNYLIKDAYSIFQEDDNFSYQNVRLIKNNKNFYYYGYTHEVILNKNSISIDKISKDSIFIKDLGDGGCKKNKIERDIRLLNLAIKENPQIIRNYFYLANTYFSKKDFKQAKIYYRKRILMKEWKQEIFYSYYKLSLIEIINNNIDNAILLLWEAYEACPERCENLYYLHKLYKELNKNNLENLVINIIIKNININNDNFLFFDKNINNKLKKNLNI